MQLDDDGAYIEYGYHRELRDGRTVRVLRSDWTDELEQIAATTDAWLGPIHPRIATIHRVFWEDKALCIETDDDRGPDFGEAAAALDGDDRERWSVAQSIGLAEACGALRARGIHPTLRMRNLFVGIDGRVRMRAPAARVANSRARTRSGPMPNLPDLAMMSPESVKAEVVTAASNVFSLASLLFQAIGGELPFVDDNPMSLMMKVLMEATRPITVRTPGLDRVLARAHEKEPAARYPDAQALAAALRECVPDAVDYDQVVSDRIVTWRASQ